MFTPLTSFFYFSLSFSCLCLCEILFLCSYMSSIYLSLHNWLLFCLFISACLLSGPLDCLLKWFFSVLVWQFSICFYTTVFWVFLSLYITIIDCVTVFCLSMYDCLFVYVLLFFSVFLSTDFSYVFLYHIFTDPLSFSFLNLLKVWSGKISFSLTGCR